MPSPPTDPAIVAAFGLLTAAGITAPWSDRATAAASVRVWALTLDDLTDDDLLIAVRAWLRSPEAKYHRWPVPAEILEALRSVRTAEAASRLIEAPPKPVRYQPIPARKAS